MNVQISIWYTTTSQYFKGSFSGKIAEIKKCWVTNLHNEYATSSKRFADHSHAIRKHFKMFSVSDCWFFLFYSEIQTNLQKSYNWGGRGEIEAAQTFKILKLSKRRLGKEYGTLSEEEFAKNNHIPEAQKFVYLLRTKNNSCNMGNA